MTSPTSIVLPADPTLTLPAEITDLGDDAARAFLEFFTARIRNPHTPGGLRARHRPLLRLAARPPLAAPRGAAGACGPPMSSYSVSRLLMVAAGLAVSSVKQHLSALRMLGDFLVVRHPRPERGPSLHRRGREPGQDGVPRRPTRPACRRRHPPASAPPPTQPLGRTPPRWRAPRRRQPRRARGTVEAHRLAVRREHAVDD